MFIIKKNQVIITALVAMIAVAGYLNYIDRNPKEPQEVVLNDESDVMGVVAEEEYVFDEDIAIASNDDIEGVDSSLEDAGQAVFVNNNSDSSYFLQAKLDREQARSKQEDILTQMINNDMLAQEQKNEAANEMLKIQERIEKETAAEAMIEAKGFEEVYVRIDDETVDVVVNKESLTEQEIAQIEDIIKRKTGASADKIRISPLKK